MITKEILFNIFWKYQNLSLFSAFSSHNQSKTQKGINCLTKNDCVYHKHWYEPVNNDNQEPKHVQIDRCAFGLLAMGSCNVECASYVPVNQKDNGI